MQVNRGRQKGHGRNRRQGCRRGDGCGWKRGHGNGRQESTNERWLGAPHATTSGNCYSGVIRPMVPHGAGRQVKTKRSIDTPKREETHRTFNDYSPGERSIKSTPSPDFTVLIDKDLCLGCGMCADICSVCAITMIDGFPVVGEGCIACGLCAQQCPSEAITLVAGKRTTPEV